ncbi:MAG: hypothetical protein ACT4OU_10955 [Hyphomicrobium sp.]
MDLILTILSPVLWLLQTLFSILAWIAWQLLWIVLWLVLPLVIVAYIAFRAAEAALGPEIVRGWLKRQSLRLGGGVWDKLSRGLIASSVLPFRVVAWFVIYTIWHAIVGLIWRPRWTPWERAWAKRWRPAPSQKPKAAVAAKRG